MSLPIRKPKLLENTLRSRKWLGSFVIVTSVCTIGICLYLILSHTSTTSSSMSPTPTMGMATPSTPTTLYVLAGLGVVGLFLGAYFICSQTSYYDLALVISAALYLFGFGYFVFKHLNAMNWEKMTNVKDEIVRAVFTSLLGLHILSVCTSLWFLVPNGWGCEYKVFRLSKHIGTLSEPDMNMLHLTGLALGNPEIADKVLQKENDEQDSLVTVLQLITYAYMIRTHNISADEAGQRWPKTMRKLTPLLGPNSIEVLNIPKLFVEVVNNVKKHEDIDSLERFWSIIRDKFAMHNIISIADSDQDEKKTIDIHDRRNVAMILRQPRNDKSLCYAYFCDGKWIAYEPGNKSGETDLAQYDPVVVIRSQNAQNAQNVPQKLN